MQRLMMALAINVCACGCGAAPAWTPPVAEDLEAAAPVVEPRDPTLEDLGLAAVEAAGRIGAALVAPFAAPAPRVHGLVRVLNHDHRWRPCASTVGIPWVWPDYREPVVGEEVRVEWTTLHMAAPREWLATVLFEITDRAAPTAHDLSILGLSGCVLQLEPIQPFGSQDVTFAATPSAEPGAWLYRPPHDAGRILMRWTPTQEFVGRSVFAHLVVWVPRNVAAGGVLLSPGLQITVGRR